MSVKLDTQKSIVVIDFDETIAVGNWPVIEKLNPNAKKVITQLHKNNTIIINTCRSGRYEGQAEDFLKANDVPYDWINCNVPELIHYYGQDCRKISGTVYIDDKNLGGIPTDWDEIYTILNNVHNIF
jgi:hypothetical protein